MHHLLTEARVGKPAALYEFIKQSLDVIAFFRPGCQLAREFLARMLAPRQVIQRALAQGDDGLSRRPPPA
jgi:hypothetical protein